MVIVLSFENSYGVNEPKIVFSLSSKNKIENNLSFIFCFVFIYRDVNSEIVVVSNRASFVIRKFCIARKTHSFPRLGCNYLKNLAKSCISRDCQVQNIIFIGI